MFKKGFLKCLATSFALLLLLVSAITPALATQNIYSRRSTDFTLRVGYWSGYGTLTNDQGEPYGYTVDMMNQIAALNKWKVAYIPCDWADGMEMLKTGELDTFGPLQKTPERELVYDFPNITMGREYGTLFTQMDNITVFYDDPQSLNGKILGTVENNYYTNKIIEYCKFKGIELQIQYFKSQEELKSAFDNKNIDLRVSGSLLVPEQSRIVTRFSIDDFYYPVTKGNSKVLNGFNSALQSMGQNALYFDEEFYQQHFQQTPIQKLAYTQKEQEYLSTKPVIRCAYLNNRFPGEYLDDNNTLTGITIDVMKELSKETGLQFTYQGYDTMEQAAQDIDMGNCDLLLGIIQNEELPVRLKLNLTQPLYGSNLAFISALHGEVPQQDLAIAVPENTMGLASHIQKYYPFLRIVYYPNSQDCLNALKRGDVDLVAHDMLTFNQYLRNPFHQEFSVSNSQYSNIFYCNGVSQRLPPELTSILNKGKLAISPEKVKNIIYNHTIAQSYVPTFMEHIRNNAVFILSVISVFFICIYVYSRYSNRKLNHIAYYDSLTGEKNLTKFKMDILKGISAKKSYAVIVVDINKFKSVNDRHGYAYGDQILRVVAKTLRKTITDDSQFCRGNADKFYIFVQHLSTRLPEDVFSAFLKELEQSLEQELPGCKLLVHAGICLLPPGETNINSIIDRANIALKKIKDSHNSTFAYYDQSMYDQLNRDREIETRMAVALKNREFKLYLQPKVELSTLKVAGAEALVRWAHPDGMMPPNSFIPLFEKNGFIVNLDFYMLEIVCEFLEQQKKDGKPLFPISINLSRAHLQLPNTAFLLYQVVSRYNISPSLLELELTESAFDNQNVEEISNLFNQLHEYGFMVSIDDFGAGYSSLALLKDLPIDVLKIDKSFFQTQRNTLLESQCKVSVLLESVFALSKKLKIRTVSEGVETREQLALLTQLGCDLAQGYFFARPMPASEFNIFLEEHEKNAVSSNP